MSREVGKEPQAALRVEGSAIFQDLLARILTAEGGPPVACGGLWGSSQALVLATLAENAQGPWLVVCSTESEAERFHEDLETLACPSVLFPAREASQSGLSGAADPQSIRRRLQVAQALTGPPERRPRLIVASLVSLLQPIPSPRDLESDYLHLQVGQNLDCEELVDRLVHSGYTREPLAERPGELSLRGDILDVFPFAADLPLRVELFDDEVESLRMFDPESQRSLEELPRLAVLVASDAGGIQDGKGIAPLQVLSPATQRVEIEPLRIEEQAEGLRIRSSQHASALLDYKQHVAGMGGLSLQSLPGRDLTFRTRSVQGLAVGNKEAPLSLAREARAGNEVIVWCATDEEAQRFQKRLAEHEGGAAVQLRTGNLGKGFRWEDPNRIVLSHRELLGIVAGRGRMTQRPTHRVRALESFFELRPGDLVVHAVHGVARFKGLARIERSGGEEEHLHLIFAEEVSLYVPASRIDLVQRYVGSGSKAPELDRIGSQSFRKRQEKVERAILDLAAELLEIQAKRKLSSRPAWPIDPGLVRSLIDSFPYEDTPDQAKADGEVATDLLSGRPMDRLLCGDVGFGKTEVALRAAFRVVSAGGQVAVLVPTTVLAKQHFETFRERFADLPVEVAMLSRHVSAKGIREAVAATNQGKVDILIGTHRILSADVDFPKLGLLIIDEEQRFGVTHKEHFKKLRSSIDVLTLTATPIPRTLHMSLSGLRDISALTEPPPGRQEIETRLLWSQEKQRIRDILLREKSRGGQSFFLHNRVQSIDRVARELMLLLPECSFAVGHGKMSGRELGRIMDTFIRGEADVLVATTIVENGIDIPSAGTILIDDADHFGLSELHQLRGRVGRGNHKAYCYLLLDQTRPLRDVAKERLKALEELTQLGAGFQISMKDLGAGNILGPQQSGHIAAVGYDMYCRLLKETVERMEVAGGPDNVGLAQLLKEIPAAVTDDLEAHAVELELGVRAFLPSEWIASPGDRLELLRKLNQIESEADATEALSMLRDRYGRVPDEAKALVRQFLLRAWLMEAGIRGLHWRGETYLVAYSDRVRLEQAFGGQSVELRPLRAGIAHLVIPIPEPGAEAALDWIEALLKPAGRPTKMAPTS